MAVAGGGVAVGAVVAPAAAPGKNEVTYINKKQRRGKNLLTLNAK